MMQERDEGRERVNREKAGSRNRDKKVGGRRETRKGK